MTLIIDWKDDGGGFGDSFAASYGPYLCGVSEASSDGSFRAIWDSFFNKNKKQSWRALLLMGESWWGGLKNVQFLDEKGFATKEDAIKAIEDKIRSDAKLMFQATKI